MIRVCKNGHEKSLGAKRCGVCHSLAQKRYRERHPERKRQTRKYRPEYYQEHAKEFRTLRRLRKEALVREFGGKCVRCGYKEHPAALDFDHLDPTKKDRGVGYYLTFSPEKAAEEAEKCQLLCANCRRIKTYDPGAFSY